MTYQLQIDDIRSFQNALENLERESNGISKNLDQSEDLLVMLEKYWISETEDEKTYFSKSYKNIEDARKIVSACLKIKSILNEYLETVKKISSEVDK